MLLSHFRRGANFPLFGASLAPLVVDVSALVFARGAHPGSGELPRLLDRAAAVLTCSLRSGERLRRCAGSIAGSDWNIALWAAVVVPITSWMVCAPHLTNSQGPPAADTLSVI